MASGAMRIVNFDPALSYKFSVEMEGILVGLFTECEGLAMEREVFEIKEGGTNDFIYKLPGRAKQTNIRLRRGVTFSHDLWDWFQNGLRAGKVKRVNLSILVGDVSGLQVQHWDVISAWPVKYEGPELKADSIQAALELLEIAHHGVILTKEIETPMGRS